ncbi:MAG: hypothetical protein IT431_06670 [Phycisphaerales bacterium]|nr:hypothetical protein [Phycisphaerales bacterium]
MPGLSPTTVHTARAVTAWALRGAGVILLAVGGYLFLKRLMFAVGMGSGGFDHIFRVYMEIGEGMSTYRGLAMLAIGAALAVFARRIAGWMVSMPAVGCPGCGYTGAVSDKCPECGLRGLDSE